MIIKDLRNYRCDPSFLEGATAYVDLDTGTAHAVRHRYCNEKKLQNLEEIVTTQETNLCSHCWWEGEYPESSDRERIGTLLRVPYYLDLASRTGDWVRAALYVHHAMCDVHEAAFPETEAKQELLFSIQNAWEEAIPGGSESIRQEVLEQVGNLGGEEGYLFFNDLDLYDSVTGDRGDAYGRHVLGWLRPDFQWPIVLQGPIEVLEDLGRRITADSSLPHREGFDIVSILPGDTEETLKTALALYDYDSETASHMATTFAAARELQD